VPLLEPCEPDGSDEPDELFPVLVPVPVRPAMVRGVRLGELPARWRMLAVPKPAGTWPAPEGLENIVVRTAGRHDGAENEVGLDRKWAIPKP
jgi:hypothetical protein